jgi:retron-type reverse transcriptase
MRVEKQHIEKIRVSFKEMQTKEDLLRLLNEVKLLIYGEKAHPFEIKQLTWYANPKLGTKRYKAFAIRKKSGAKRYINAPEKGLKQLQKAIAFVLQCVFEPHKAVTGFVWNKSIVNNAKIHEGSKYVYNLDLKDFFPSIDQARVWKCLQLKPFNLNKDTVVENYFMTAKDFSVKFLQGFANELLKDIHGEYADTTVGKLYFSKNLDMKKDAFVIFKGKQSDSDNSKADYLLLSNEQQEVKRLELANMIAAICCTEMEVERLIDGEWVSVKKNVLPQGAPTSPVFSNIICQRLDYLLSAVAKRFGLKYSRYADDITFSSMHNVYQPESDFLNEIQRIIGDQGFHIKESKTRLQKEGYRQEVTGLLVNEKVNVQKRYIKQLRMWIYYWENYGYEKAESLFRQDYVADKGHTKKGLPNMLNVLKGKLDYLKMVKGEDNALYLKLRERFDRLAGEVDNFVLLINLWEEKGIDSAIDAYNKQ